MVTARLLAMALVSVLVLAKPILGTGFLPDWLLVPEDQPLPSPEVPIQRDRPSG